MLASVFPLPPHMYTLVHNTGTPMVASRTQQRVVSSRSLPLPMHTRYPYASKVLALRGLYGGGTYPTQRSIARYCTLGSLSSLSVAW